MKKTAALLVALLLTTAASAQIGGIAPWAFPRQTLVAALPAPDGTEGLRIVTDDADCNAATADNGVVLCLDTGAAWELVAGGGGGTATDGDSATGFFPAGTLEHERGGLEADVSAFAGLLRIAAGSTSAVSTLAGLNTALGSSIADGAHTVDTDTTCLDAGVSCLFAASASEGGAATTAVALAANGANCTAGSYPLGVDASGAAEGCTAASGGGSPAGAGSELQYRSDATTFGAVTGSSVSGGAVTLAGTLSIDPDAANGYDFQARMDGGIARFEIRDRAAGANMERWQVEGGGDSSNGILTFGLLNDAASSWTAQHVLRLIAGGTNRVDINGDLRKTGDSNTGLTWSTTDVVGLTAGGVYGISQSTTETTLAVEQVNSPATQTCTDEGTGAAGALTVAVSGTSNVEVTNSDAHGCAATLSETGATRGQALTVSNVSNAGGTLDFADAAGVQETGAGCSLGLYGVAVFRFISDRWLLASCQPTN